MRTGPDAAPPLRHALVETVDILSRPDEVAALREAIAELESGEVSSADEVRAAMVARGRLAE